MKAVIFNLGCKVNQYECDVLAQELSKRGFATFSELVEADLYIINTCAVTKEAEKKSRQAIARCKKLNNNCSIIVCGCASEKAPESFGKENVRFVGGVAEKMKILNIIDTDFSVSNTISIAPLPLVCEETELEKVSRTRAFVKIQDGCDNFCSYCIIPYLRGRSRSRSIEDIVREVDLLSKNTCEIVLTGINMSSYGKDIGVTLTDLIRRLAHFDVRIRLGSFYAEAINEELLSALFALKKFCPHFHLSLQSGDDSVLKAMRRKYTTNDYKKAIDLIRSYDSNAAITTDIIVGFPTESEENFAATTNFITKIGFSDIHIFPFSAREGTVAYSYPVLPAEVVGKRKEILTDIKKNAIKHYLSKNIGVAQEVLIEKFSGEYNEGYSRYYIKTYTKQEGTLVNVKPTAIFKDGLKE